MVAMTHPTKLFIGGISKETTTKTLRDHFSQYARVLDCVAMKQPDGKSRGFGLVTVDSVAGAERCLGEPMVVDGRVVDMKMAVPTKALRGNSVRKEAPGQMIASQLDSVIDVLAMEPCKEQHSRSAEAAMTAVCVPVPLSASAPEFVPLAAKAPTRPSKAVREAPAEDMLVFAEDYVSFLEEQQRLCVLVNEAPRKVPVPLPIVATAPSTEACEEALIAAAYNGPSVEDLPSVGALLHDAGDCRPCNFYSRGACSSGRDCNFCHFTHEKVKLKRQGKRERKAAAQREASQQGSDVASESSEDYSEHSGLITLAVGAPPGLDRCVQSVLCNNTDLPLAPVAPLNEQCQPQKTMSYLELNSSVEGMHGIAFPAFAFASPFNFADYEDSDSDSEEAGADTAVASTVALVSPSAEDSSVKKSGGQDSSWSLVEMLRVRALMSSGAAAVETTNVGCLLRMSDRR